MEFAFEEFTDDSSPIRWAHQNVNVVSRVRPREGSKVLRIATRPLVSTLPNVSPSKQRRSSGSFVVRSRTLQRALAKRELESISITFDAPAVVVALVDYRPAPVEVLAVAIKSMVRHCLCLVCVPPPSWLRQCLSLAVPQHIGATMDLGQTASLKVKIAHMQIDNGNLYSEFPVALAPADVQSVDKPFIHVSMVKSLKDASIDSYPYISVLMQEANLGLDDALLSSVIELFTDKAGKELMLSRFSVDYARFHGSLCARMVH